MSKNIPQQVLKTATQLFNEQGIYQTGVDTLSKKAKVAKMSLYKYYPNKEALVLAYLEAETESFFNDLDKVFSSEVHVLDKVKALIAVEKEKFLAGDYKGCPFINASMEERGVSSPVHSLTLEAKEELRLRLKSALEASGYQNSLELSHALVLVLNGLYTQAVISNFQDCFSYASLTCEALLS